MLARSVMAGMAALIAAAPFACEARTQPRRPAPARLMLVDYAPPPVTNTNSARRFLLPDIEEPTETRAKPLLRIRGTRVKMRVPI